METSEARVTIVLPEKDAPAFIGKTRNIGVTINTPRGTVGAYMRREEVIRLINGLLPPKTLKMRSKICPEHRSIWTGSRQF